ncbi:hypothetical protein ABPG74_019686 [Tetrahymena malaccensis]
MAQNVSCQEIQRDQIEIESIQKEKIMKTDIEKEKKCIENVMEQKNKIEFDESQNQKIQLKNCKNQQIETVQETGQNSHNISEKECLLRCNFKEINTQNITNKNKQIQQNKKQIENIQYFQIGEDESPNKNLTVQESFEIKFGEIQTLKEKTSNLGDQKTQQLSEINKNISEIENIQFKNKIQQEDEQNFSHKQIVLADIIKPPQIQIDKCQLDQHKDSLMEIENEKEKDINIEDQSILFKEQSIKIVNNQLNCIPNQKLKKDQIQNEIQENKIMDEIIKWVMGQNDQIQKNYEFFFDNQELQNNLNLLITQLKLYSYDEKNYRESNSRVLKIVDITDIPDDKEDFEVIEIEYENKLPSQEEVSKIGNVLRKQIFLEYLSLTVKNCTYVYSFRNTNEKCAFQFLKCLDSCINLSSLSLNLKLDNEGQQLLAKWVGKCRNLFFLNLNLQLPYQSNGEYKISNIISGISQCVNLVHLDFNLNYSQISEQDFNNFNLIIANCANLSFLSFNATQSPELFYLFVQNLQKCKKLITLNLSLRDNGKSYLQINLILKSLQSLEQLKTLELRFISSSLETISLNQTIEFYKYKSLTNFMLDVTNCSINTQKVNDLLRSLENNQSLSCLHLQLYTDQFNQSKNDELEICFYKFKNLTNLSLNLTKYISIEDDKINWSFYKCEKLNFLNLSISYDNINVIDLESFGLSISKCKQLTTLKLNLRGCSLGLINLSNFGMQLSQCVQIHSLDMNLSTNQIGMKEANVIGQTLAKLQNLTQLSLNLRYNQIRSKGTTFIAQGLKWCQKLTLLSLYLSSTMVSVKAIQSLGNYLKENQQINFLNLDLSNNKLTSQVASSISMIIKDHQNIKQLNLNLSSNNIDRIGLISIQNEIIKCQQLLSLQFSFQQNPISLIDKQNFEQELKQKILSLRELQFDF